MVNTNKLKGRLKELGYTQVDLAKYMEVTEGTLNKKLNDAGGQTLTVDEVSKIAKFLNISKNKFSLYFFVE